MIGAHPMLVLLSGIACGAIIVASVVMLPVILVRLPADYFVREEPSPASWRQRHPIMRWMLRVLKNLCGVLLFVAGVVMLVTPGQGILTILIGVGLIDLPGKRRLELWLVRRPLVLGTINWLRQKSRQPPVQLPLEDDRAAR